MPPAPTRPGESTAPSELATYAVSFARSLRAANKAPNTIAAYMEASPRSASAPQPGRQALNPFRHLARSWVFDEDTSGEDIGASHRRQLRRGAAACRDVGIRQRGAE